MTNKRITFQAILSFLVSLAIIYGTYELLKIVLGLLSSIDKQVAAAIIAASGTVLAAVAAALYVQRRTREREIFEAHRPQKIEIYKQFMETVTNVLRKSKDENADTSSEALAKEYEDFFIDFTRDLIVWGSPNVIKAFENFRLGSTVSGTNAVLLVDDILREIRNDLGNSNRGINRGDLIKLFLKDPQELDKMIQKELSE